MGLTFQRFQLRATTVAVNNMRFFVDGCSRVLRTVSSPFRKFGRQLSLEGPWVIALFTCTWVSAIPLLIYPYVKNFVFKDKRTLMEEERVRLCLQKGIDPYPYIKNKDYVYGNNFPGLARENEYPLNDAWEHRAIMDFQREKEALVRECNGSIDDTVERLLELRNKMRQEAEPQRYSSNEPADLIFRRPRNDVNQL